MQMSQMIKFQCVMKQNIAGLGKATTEWLKKERIKMSTRLKCCGRTLRELCMNECLQPSRIAARVLLLRGLKILKQ